MSDFQKKDLPHQEGSVDASAVRFLRGRTPVIIEQNSVAKLVEIGALIYAGSGEELGLDCPRGTAHMTEHCLGLGSANFGPNQAEAIIKSCGGSLAAEVDQESMALRVFVPPEEVKAGIEAVADLVCRPRLSLKHFERERDVVMSEIMEAQFHGDERDDNLLWHTAFGGHPYFATINGTFESVQTITPGHLEMFHAACFRAERTALFVNGPVDPDAVVSLAEPLWDLPSGMVSLPPQIPFVGGEVREHQDLLGARITIGFAAPSFGHAAGVFATEVFALMLGGEANGLLYEELRTKRGLTYAGSNVDNFVLQNGSLFCVQGYALTKNVRPFLAILADTMGRLSRTSHADFIDFHLEQASEVFEDKMNDYLCVAERVRTKGPEAVMLEVKPPSIRQIQEAGRALLKGPITLLLTGNLSEAPSYEEVQRLFASAAVPAQRRRMVCRGNRRRQHG